MIWEFRWNGGGVLCYATAMSMYRHRGSNRRAAWLAALALLAQALLPALHHPGGMALAGTPSLVDARHLCLAPGSAPVSPADTDKSPAHHQPACPICQAVHAIGGFAPPAAPTITGQIAAPASFSPVGPASPALRPTFNRQQPRAPPSLA